MRTPSVTYLTTLPLKYHGDCSLIGVTPNGTIYAEEVYGDEGWIAQHELRQDGTLVRSADENNGSQSDVQPLTLPAELTKPKTGWHTMGLNFAGPRHRGLRTPNGRLTLCNH